MSLRKFNKYIYNPVMMLFAGKLPTPLVVIQHVGRKTGRLHNTPLIAIKKDNDFLVALTYGTDVDWYKNILKEGECALFWHGKKFTILDINPIERQTALPIFPRILRAGLKLLGTNDFIILEPINNSH